MLSTLCNIVGKVMGGAAGCSPCNCKPKKAKKAVKKSLKRKR